MIRPQPKPVRAPKKPRQPMRRGKPIERKRWGTSRRVDGKRALKLPESFQPKFPKPVSPKGTKHRRRPRELGRMLFYSGLWCMLRRLARNGNIPPANVAIIMSYGGPIEVAHLGDRGATGSGGWRRAPDRLTAPLSRDAHRAIDGKVGGKAPWYVALGREGQRELRRLLVLFADNYWQMLTPEGRAEWDRKAAAERAR